MAEPFELVKKVEIETQDCMIFKYVIKFEDRLPEGDCCIFLQRFETLKLPLSGINKPQIAKWHKLGLTNNDFFACLDDFYPNGRYFLERDNYLRKGVGKKVLGELLKDIESHNPKLIYAIPTNEKIKSFLLVNGWKSDYKNNKVMYRLFNAT